MKINSLDKSINSLISEVFNTSATWVLDSEVEGKKIYTTLVDGNHIELVYKSPDNFKKKSVIEFFRDDESDITGGGSAPLIFGAVINHIINFVKENNLEKISFTAYKPKTKDDQILTNRTRLYKKMANRLATALGYSTEVIDKGRNDLFIISKNKTETTEQKVKKILENIDKKDLINQISDKARAKLINHILKSLHELVSEYGNRQSISGYAFEISKQIGGMFSAREIEKMYRKEYMKESQTKNKIIENNKIIDNQEGWGAVSDNSNVDYKGLRVNMSPRVFNSLAAPLGMEPSQNIIKHITSGGKIGSPFLIIDIPESWDSDDFSIPARVVGHEGRNRMLAIEKTIGNNPIEVHLFFTKGLRNRHITDEFKKYLNKSLSKEKSKKIVNGPLFSLIENISEDGRIVKGVNTTLDVGVDEIKRQAAKFGNVVDKDGRPPELSKKVKGKRTNVLYNMGLSESNNNPKETVSKNKKILELIMDVPSIKKDSSWKNELWGLDIAYAAPDATYDGNFKNFKIFMSEKGSYLKNVYITTKNNLVMGRIHAQKISDKAPVYRVHVAALAPRYQGRGLMNYFYEYLITNKDIILAADILQSSGAKKSWANLNKFPSITVYSAIKKRNGKWEYSQLEGDDYLTGDDPVYNSEFESELKSLEYEIDQIKDKVQELTKEYQIEGDKKLLADINFYKKELSKLENEYRNISSEQRQRQVDYEGSYLLAISSKKKLSVSKKNESKKIFPEIEKEIYEDLPKAFKKAAKAAAVAGSIGSVGLTGYAGHKAMTSQNTNSPSVAAVSVDKSHDTTSSRVSNQRPRPRPDTSPQVDRHAQGDTSSATTSAPEKSPIPPARPSSIMLTDNPHEEDLIKYAQRNGIQGNELIALLSQVAVETNYYEQMVERGSQEYFNRYEPDTSPDRAEMLGNTQQGDGFRYRGRGYVQLTGRYNYEQASKALGIDFIENPELASEPANALRIAIWYWNWRVSNNMNDFDNVARVTRFITGSKKQGLDRRETAYERYRQKMIMSGNLEENRYSKLELAILEGGHSLDEHKPRQFRKLSLFDSLNDTIKIYPTSVHDHYRGESFGEKILTVDGFVKAKMDLSILSDEVHIRYIETADDSLRKGYARMLVDDLFTEFPNRKITISMMTDSGSVFFKKNYNIDQETGEISKKNRKSDEKNK